MSTARSGTPPASRETDPVAQPPSQRQVSVGLHPLLALRLALRQLRRAPGAGLVAALTLAIGLGAATAIYSVLEGFQAPLPVPDGERVVQVRVLDPQGGRSAITAADLRAWSRESRSLESVGAFTTMRVTLASDARPARLVRGAEMTAAVFELLRVKPLLGRLPTREEAAGEAGEPVAVVSDSLWRGGLGGDPDVLGQMVRLGGELRTVIGVIPAGFRFPFREDVWVVRDVAAGDWSGWEVVARLADGVSRRAAGEELEAILSRSRTAASGVESTARVEVLGFTEERGESGETTMLLGLLLMVLALVLVSCSNVSHLLLERAVARARGLSVHQALGAVPGQVVLQVLTEALLIAVPAVILGLAVASGVVRYVETTLADHWGYFWMEVRLQPSALGFAALLGLATALASGTLPAWRARRADIAEPLKQEAKTSRGGGRGWASWMLLTGQVAFSCAAVIASVLMGLGLFESRRVEEGFPAESVLWASLTFDGQRGGTAEARSRFRRVLLEELGRSPAVRAAALSTGLPGLHSPTLEVTVEGRRGEEPPPTLPVSAVTPGFFEVFGLRLVEGRGFRALESPGDVAVVSADFVRRHLDGGSAIGRTLDLRSPGGETREARIVGVAADVVIYAGDRDRDRSHVYLPIGQGGPSGVDGPAGADDPRQLYVVLRAAGEGGDVAAALAQAARSAGPEIPVGEVTRVSDMLAYVRQFFETLGTLAILGGLGAVLVVTLGLYGVLSFDVRRRIPEFAVRLALGAGAGRVLWGVVRRGLGLLLPGVAIGLGLTYAVTPLLGVFLGRADAHDPRIFAVAVAIYLGIAVLAAGLPARRAAFCNPADVLRED